MNDDSIKVLKTAYNDKQKINIARYKYFLLYIKDYYENYSEEIRLSYTQLNISRWHLYKYRNKALRDNILYPVVKEIKVGNKIVDKTYSYKKNSKSIIYKINIDILNNILLTLEGIKADWVNNHRKENYNKYIQQLKDKNENKRLKGIKNYNLNKVKISSDLLIYKIANSQKVIDALYKKYTFVKDYQMFIEQFNINLPDPLKIKFEFKLTPNKNKKYIQKISIRATNRLCNVISDEKEHKNKFKTKTDILKKYGLYDSMFTPFNDTPSSIPRLIYSLNNNKWLQEDFEHCCYRMVLDKIVYKYKNCSFFELDNNLQKKLRNSFKPILLGLLFCKNYKQQIARNIALKSDDYNLYYELAKNIIKLNKISFRETDNQIKNIMFSLAEELYDFLGTGKNNENFIGTEIFLWESILEIEMIKQLYKLFPDLIVFMQYDSLYINKLYLKFKELRGKTFNKIILPLYKKYKEEDN